jgi:lipopolysaccharide export system permease protein
VIIDRYLIRQFLPVFIVAISMFVMLFLLIDLFLNLVHYLNYEAAFSDILRATILYVPKSMSFAIPVSLIFAIAYTLGDLYARNELTSIISSGIPFWRIGTPLLIIGLCVSLFSFFFDDRVVVPTLRDKNELTRRLRHIQSSEKNTNIVIKTNEGKRIYVIDFFDDINVRLNGIIIIERDNNGRFVSEIRAQAARWENGSWVFSNAVIYSWEGKLIRLKPFTPTEPYTDDPEIFHRNSVQPEDLNAYELGLLVDDLKLSGLPYKEALADYYHRYSFSAVSFIVVILSISMAGRFRKNIVLMSLLFSLGIGVVYYVMEMISMMLASYGYIPPIAGAWFPVVFFTLIGIILVRYSKT